MNSFKRVRAFQIELEFGSVGFWGEGKTGVPGEKPLGARERTNNKGVDAGSRTRATMVGGERSHHCATLAPQYTLAVFLCRANFRQRIITPGVNFCGNLYLTELIFGGSLEKSQKSQELDPAKISCHTVGNNQGQRLSQTCPLQGLTLKFNKWHSCWKTT